MLRFTLPNNFLPESELGGNPCRCLETNDFQGWKWETVEWGQIVRDGDGNVIFTRPPCNAMNRMLSEVLGKTLFPVYFVDGRSNYPDQIAFGLPAGVTLDAEETGAVVLAAWINRDYLPGIKRTGSPRLPDDLNEYAARPDSPVAMDAAFYSMADANQMASLLPSLYYGETGGGPKVVRDGNRWGVVIPNERFLDSARAAELAGIHKLLGKYSIAPKTDTSNKSVPLAERFEAQAAFETRVEDSLNAILAHMGHPKASERESVSFAARNAATGTETAPVVADSIATGAELVANIEAGAHRNRRTTGAAKPAGKKSSAKRPA